MNYTILICIIAFLFSAKRTIAGLGNNETNSYYPSSGFSGDSMGPAAALASAATPSLGDSSDSINHEHYTSLGSCSVSSDDKCCYSLGSCQSDTDCNNTASALFSNDCGQQSMDGGPCFIFYEYLCVSSKCYASYGKCKYGIVPCSSKSKCKLPGFANNSSILDVGLHPIMFPALLVFVFVYNHFNCP